VNFSEGIASTILRQCSFDLCQSVKEFSIKDWAFKDRPISKMEIKRYFFIIIILNKKTKLIKSKINLMFKK
jgi:hypothetical protein